VMQDEPSCDKSQTTHCVAVTDETNAYKQQSEAYKNFCDFGCHTSLKTSVATFFIGAVKILVHFLFGFKVLLKKNCLHLIRCAAVLLGAIACSSASDSAYSYSYPFLRSVVWSVCRLSCVTFVHPA